MILTLTGIGATEDIFLEGFNVEPGDGCLFLTADVYGTSGQVRVKLLDHEAAALLNRLLRHFSQQFR